MDHPHLLPAPPDVAGFTAYDRAVSALYLRLLDADAEGASWQEAAEIVLGQNIHGDADGAERMHAAYLGRARWLRDGGFLRVIGE